MAPIEPGENLGEERFGVIIRNPEPDRAPEALAGQRRHRPGLDLDDAPREFDQPLALGGQPRPAPVLDEQRTADCSSSLRMCIETADCVLWTRSAALVKEPVSTMARKERS